MSTAWNANPKPVGGFAPRALGETRDDPARTELKTQLAQEYEQHLPEGIATRGRRARLVGLTLGTLSLLGIVAMVYFLGFVAGWVAAVLGLAIMAMFIVAGASGYVFGATERARDQMHIKAEVVKDIEAIEHGGMAETGETARANLP